MPDISDTDLERARIFGLDRFSVRLLGAIAARGMERESIILSNALNEEERSARKKQLDELVKRDIIKRDANGLLALGESGKGQCKWIWGKAGKPSEKMLIAKKTRKQAKPAAKKPATGQPPRQSRAGRLQKVHAIERYLRKHR
ncbi:MAG: hypothetical protein NT067_02820 [Candidatus Diapherotrites archaeon]|nr:hypothetical protein [Candidatus Diapherotrites archaeon]